MTKDEKIHTKRMSDFNRLYGSAQVLCVMLEKMAGDDGKPTTFHLKQVIEAQKLSCEIRSSSLALTETFDGQPLPPKK